MNITNKLNLFVMKGVEGDQFRRKIAVVAVAVGVIALVAFVIYIAVSASPSVAGVNSLPVSLSDNPELIVTRRSAAASPLTANPELLVAQRHAETGPESAFSRTAAEMEFYQRYQSAGQITSAYQRTPAEMEFAQRYFSAGQISTASQSTSADPDFAARYCATEEQLFERYGCK
jgi:hypothetical protein